MFTQKKAIVINNGIASELSFTDNYQLYKRFNRDSVFLNLLIIGTIDANKNQDVAIKAVNILKVKYPYIKLFIVGQGDQNKLKNIVHENALESIILFYGHVADTTEIYLNTDILLMCSNFESFGRVTVEAMSYGIPVIGYNNGGTAEIIKHEFNGLLYDGSEKELSNEIVKVISNETLRKSISFNGWSYAKNHFTTEKYLQEIEKVLKKFYKSAHD